MAKEDEYADGEKQGVAKIIKNMLRKGKSPEEIADLTGESLENVLSIQKDELIQVL